jgi:hypothetical protein
MTTPSVQPADQVMVQSMTLAAIPAVTMLLGGIYPLVSSRPPNKLLSFALQHFAGISSPELDVSLKPLKTLISLQRVCFLQQ